MNTDKRNNELLNANLTIISDLKDKEQVGIIYNFIPTSAKQNNYFHKKYKDNIEKKLEEIMAINLLNEGWEVKFDVAKKYDNKIIRSDIIAKSDKDEWIIEVKSASNWFYISEDEKKEKVLTQSTIVEIIEAY